MSTLNKSLFACILVSIIGILLAAPITGIIANASASTVEDSFTPFSQLEELQQQEDGGGETIPPSPPLAALITIDSTDGDTAPATFLFEASAEGGTEPYTFLWDFGDGQQSDIANIEHTFEQAGTYVVSLTATDSAGQTASDRGEVNVRPATTTEEPQVPTNATTPQPTEPAPTQNQTQVEQNQTEITGAVESIQCPAPLRPTNRPIDLKSGNGAIGATDPLNQFSTTGSAGLYNPAFIVAKDQNWADPLPGTRYISSDPNRQLPASGDIWYKVEFTLPSNAKSPSLNVKVHADNQATIFLNNPTTNQIGQQTPQYSVQNFLDPAESFGTTANFVTGSKNTLYFRVTNVDFITGLDYNATVTYCLEPNVVVPPGNVSIGGPTNPPTGTSGNVTCPANNVQHWDKIIFTISPGLASSLGLPAESMLDIKVLDDPKTVADIEKKVLGFLNQTDNSQNRDAIFVVDVEYAIICAR